MKTKYKYIKIKLNEQFINECKNNILLNEMVDEEQHMFNSQYKLSNEIANVVYTMCLKNINKNIYLTSNNEKIDVVEINIDDYISVTNNIVANIDKVNGDKKRIRINITLPPKLLVIDKEKAINNMSNVIAHELMHGNIFINRINNKEDINDAPNYYGNLIKILKLYDYDEIVHKFAYALYATYHQEMNAIISQTSITIYSLIKQDNITSIDNNTIKDLLLKCEPYQIYTNILYDTIPKIENMDEQQIYQYIVKHFNNVGIDCDINFVLNNLKIIKEKSQKALRKIASNALLTFKEEIF